jgi:DNA-binding response OmpR family regulator
MPRILLIDDEEPLRTLLRTTLERAGYEVIEASDGKIGLQLLAESSVDLVITDLVMPEKEGLETILELRRQNSSAKIIAISGGGRMNPKVNLAMAEQFGALCTLAKPFSQQEILDAVAEALGQRG